MLIIKKVKHSSVAVYNADTGTTFEIPTHWLQIDKELKPGDVIKVVKDEMTTRRMEKERFVKAKDNGVAHLYDWPNHVYKDNK